MSQPTQTVLITGGNTGLGFQAAKVLAITGEWHIVIASRHAQRNQEAVAQLTSESNNPHITALSLDLGSLQSIRQCVAAYENLPLPPLMAIVANAGLNLNKPQTTQDGFEMTFGVNHLGHFLLINLLIKHIQPHGRVIWVSSGTHDPKHRLARLSGIPSPKYVNARVSAYPDKAAPQDRPRNLRQIYSTSKLCNVFTTYELSRRLTARGLPINVFSIDPGLMPNTQLSRDYPAILRGLFSGFFLTIEPLLSGVRRVEQSGRDLARLVTDPALQSIPTAYFDGHRQTPSSVESYDEAKAHELWETSRELVGLRPEEDFFVVGLEKMA